MEREKLILHHRDSIKEIHCFSISKEIIQFFEECEHGDIQSVEWKNIRESSTEHEFFWFCHKIFDKLQFSGSVAFYCVNDILLPEKFFFPADTLGAILAPYEKNGVTGVRLGGVHSGGIAERAGLQIDDVLIEFDGIKIGEFSRPWRFFKGSETQEIGIRYLRNGQENQEKVSVASVMTNAQIIDRIANLFGLQKTEDGKYYKPKPELSSNPLVSVLLHAYKPNWFAEALQSVLDQSYTNLEIIIGDDNNRGEIKEIVDRVAGGDPRIRYFLHDPPLRGWGAGNRYFCFNQARGDLIKYLCDDDILYPNCIEKMVQALKKHPEVSLVTSHRHTINGRGGIGIPHPATRHISYYDMIVEGLRAVNVFHGIASNAIGEPSTTMFRRSHGLEKKFYLDAIGGVEAESGVDDIGLWFSLLCKGRLFYFTEALSAFRVTKEQSSGDSDLVNDVRGKWKHLLVFLQKLGGLEYSDLLLKAKIISVSNDQAIENQNITDLSILELQEYLEIHPTISKQEAKFIITKLKWSPEWIKLQFLVKKSLGLGAFPTDLKTGLEVSKKIACFSYISRDFPINWNVDNSEKGYVLYIASLGIPHYLTCKIDSTSRIEYCLFEYNQGPQKQVKVEKQLIRLEFFAEYREHLFVIWGVDKNGQRVNISFLTPLLFQNLN